jgi:hypothetical protein
MFARLLECRHRREIDVVEDIQHVHTELEVDTVLDREPLGQAHVEAREGCSDEERPRRAVTGPQLNAVLAVSRRDVAALWCAQV